MNEQEETVNILEGETEGLVIQEGGKGKKTTNILRGKTNGTVIQTGQISGGINIY